MISFQEFKVPESSEKKEKSMSIKASEFSALLEQRVSNVYSSVNVDEIGRVVSIGDGIARIYGLNNVQSGELVEFSNGLQGIVLNLEEDNVGAVLLGSSNADDAAREKMIC